MTGEDVTRMWSAAIMASLGEHCTDVWVFAQMVRAATLREAEDVIRAAGHLHAACTVAAIPRRSLAGDAEVIGE